jgi:putative transposase
LTTDAVLGTVVEWQNRPLETSYPRVFFDAIRVKIRDDAWFAVRPSISRLALRRTGPKTSWAFGSRRPRAKFWLNVMNDLKARGVEDILTAPSMA